MNLRPAQPNRLDMIYQLFRKDYFLYDLGKEGLFCMPNFRAWEDGDKIKIQFLSHITAEDEAAVLARLHSLENPPEIEILPKRPTLEEIEKASGVRFE